MMRGRGERFPWAAALLLVLLGTVGCSEKAAPPDPKAAPPFELQTADGAPVRLSQYRGQVVLLDFWATWCPPCRVAIPHLVELQDRYRADGLQVIGLSMDYDPEDLNSFLTEHGVNYPMVTVNDDTRVAYGGVASIPTTFLVDRAGRIRDKFLGFDNQIAERMERRIQTLLQEKPGAP